MWSASRQTLEPGETDQHKKREGEEGERSTNQSQEWETMAHAWITAFSEAKDVSKTEVEAWLESNFSCLPTELQSMPHSHLIDRLLSIQNYFKLPNQVAGTSLVDAHHARFQRTDQWLPVYSWLESLDRDEVVKSKDITDWLEANPDIREQLNSRHSRYHLMHYIKKCHVKILKRREKKKKSLHPTYNLKPGDVQKNVELKEAAQIPKNPVSNLPKDSDLYLVKQKEARQKYEILVALEKFLMPHFAKPQEGIR